MASYYLNGGQSWAVMDLQTRAGSQQHRCLVQGPETQAQGSGQDYRCFHHGLTQAGPQY